MVQIDGVRALALALPEAVEADHHGFPSFRVRGKVFATLPRDGQLNAMIDPEEVAAAVALCPGVAEELWWGKRLCGVKLSLAEATRAQVARLLADAWAHKAPASLRRKR
jgi:hypothetical protein